MPTGVHVFMRAISRMAATAVVLSVVCRGGLVAAQTPADGNHDSSPASPQQKPDDQTARGKANPLVVGGPTDTAARPLDRPTSARPANDARAFNDYRFDPTGLRPTASQAPLPLFGYDSFAFARQAVAVRRAMNRRRYRMDEQGNDLTGRTNTGQQERSGAKRSDDRNSGSQSTVSGDSSNRGTSRDATDARTSGDGVGSTSDMSTDDAYQAADLQLPEQGDQNDDQNQGADDSNTNGQSRQSRSDVRTRTGSQSDQQPDQASALNAIVDPDSLLFNPFSATVPPNYQLEPGDTITVRYWSATMPPETRHITIDAEGRVTVAGLSPISVRGQTIDRAERTIETYLRHYYRGAQATVTLGKPHSIAVTVSGSVLEPGPYLVPAGTTAYNILIAAGGPTDSGTLRNIQVRRAGRTIGVIDVYRFLLDGSHSGDVPMQAGDLLYVPPRQSRVVVDGEVVRPAVFELAQGETLSDALHYAGGIKPTGLAQQVLVSTVVPGSEHVIRDVDIRDTATSGRTPLYDGDEVNVLSVRATIANPITVTGAVAQPGDYAWSPGMRISDAIARAAGALPEAYEDKAELYRWNPDNSYTLTTFNLSKALDRDPREDMALDRWDRIRIYARDEVEFVALRQVAVRGAVQKPGVYTRSEHMRVSDLLRMAGNPTPDAYLDRAELLHHHGDGTYAYDHIRLAAALEGDASQDPELQDRDVLAVYAVSQASYQSEHTVTIRGAVVTEGTYDRGEGMRLTDLMRIAGGPRPDAGARVVIGHARTVLGSPDSAVLVATVNVDAHGLCAPQDDVLLQDGDVVTLQGTGGYVPTVQVINVVGAVQHPGPVILTSKTMRLSDAIARAGGLRPEAFPQGAEFTRDPKLLTTTGQTAVADDIARLTDLQNKASYQQEEAKAKIDVMKAAGSAAASTVPLGGAAPAVPIPGSVVDSLGSQQLVQPARSLSSDQMKPNGNIAVNLPAALARAGGPDDIILVNGDTITVPERPTTVQVTGAVINGRAVLYKPGEGMGYYIERAGGFAADANRSSIEIIRVGGGVITARGARQLEPGDEIFVPTKVIAPRISGSGNNIGNIFSQLTSSAIMFRLFTGIFGL